MQWLGDYAHNYPTLNFKFATKKSDGTPITLAGTPAVSVYKAGSLTESVAGVTLTVDFDSLTGLHNVLIDLSADAFYAAGNDYAVVVTTGAVDSISYVGTVLALFSIQNRYNSQTGDSYPIVNHTDYGNAKLVRSTTPANTLSVDSSHRAPATLAAAAVSGDLPANVTKLIGTAPTESGAGRLAASLTMLLDVPTPVLTAASINQTGDSFAVVKSGGTGDTAAIKTQTDKLAFTVANQVDANVLKLAGTTQTAVDVGAQLDGKISDIPMSVWNVVTSALTAVSSVGKRIADYLDAAISTRFATSGYTVPPTAVDNATAVWDEDLAGHLASGSTGASLNASGSQADPWNTPLPGGYTSGTAGKIVGDRIDAAISTRTKPADTQAAVSTVIALDSGCQATLVSAIWAATTRSLSEYSSMMGDFVAAVWAAATRSLTDKVGFALTATPPTAGEVATAVWAAGTRTLSSLGSLVSDTTTAVWAAGTRTLSDKTGFALTGAYDPAKTAAQSSDIPASNIAAIKAKTDNLPASPAAASDIPAADITSIMDAVAQIAAPHIDPLTASIIAIKAKTDNLPDSPAASGDIPVSDIAAIKSKTDNLPFAPAAVGDIPTAVENADKLLGRAIAGGSDEGRTVQDALRRVRNKVVRSGTTLTVFEEDDATPAWSATIIADATAAPIISVDPA